MIVGVIGSRRYPQMGLVREFVEGIVDSNIETVLATGTMPGSRGGAPWGVDETAANAYEIASGRQAMIFEPKSWRRRDILDRDRELSESVDRLFAFWDLSSGGTAYTLRHFLSLGKIPEVYGPDGEVVRVRVDRGRVVVDDGEGRDHPPTNEERAALEDDPFVRSLMEAFDAKALSIRM